MLRVNECVGKRERIQPFSRRRWTTGSGNSQACMECCHACASYFLGVCQNTTPYHLGRYSHHLLHLLKSSTGEIERKRECVRRVVLNDVCCVIKRSVRSFIRALPVGNLVTKNSWSIEMEAFSHGRNLIQFPKTLQFCCQNKHNTRLTRTSRSKALESTGCCFQKFQTKMRQARSFQITLDFWSGKNF